MAFNDFAQILWVFSTYQPNNMILLAFCKEFPDMKKS